MDTSSNLFHYISVLLDKTVITCCICNEIPNQLYLICKPRCTKYSYCKQCIEKIEYLYSYCPFTKISFLHDDIALDYRNNELLEIYKRYYKYTIKNVSCT